ncbi:hypothetical protein D0Z70_03800 [Sphingobium terrigena]|uniref:Uncharacterized protein n=2 Tax=Sphingobium terrigena TaxID=2304063 RepID=A0A418YXF8_9SPHN|nr:hypothetical protein D0Z70_03800 [Sphingobium terrigena]
MAQRSPQARSTTPRKTAASLYPGDEYRHAAAFLFGEEGHGLLVEEGRCQIIDARQIHRPGALRS